MPATDLKLIKVFIMQSQLAIMLIVAHIYCAITRSQTLLHELTFVILWIILWGRYHHQPTLHVRKVRNRDTTNNLPKVTHPKVMKGWAKIWTQVTIYTTLHSFSLEGPCWGVLKCPVRPFNSGLTGNPSRSYLRIGFSFGRGLKANHLENAKKYMREGANPLCRIC